MSWGILSQPSAKADITVKIEGTPVQVCIDSGATANTIDYATYEAISAAKTVPLKPTNVKLRTLGEDNPAPILLARLFFGMINTPSGQMDLTRFLVLKARNAGCRLSFETLTCLGMLHVVAFTTTEHSPVHREYQYLSTEVPSSVHWQNRETKRSPTWAQHSLNRVPHFPFTTLHQDIPGQEE